MGHCTGFYGLLKKTIPVVVVLLAVVHTLAAESNIVHPFESYSGSVPSNEIDRLVRSALKEKDIKPANPCSDEVFIRRVYLDMIGTLPESAKVRSFLNDKSRDKRKILIDSLFERQEFADYWTLKWCDLLRVKAEFPINLWPNAVQAYHRWVHDVIKTNMPYDKFARELLTSSGSNFRVPQVNFYRAIQGKEPSAIAGAVGLTFMGTRLETWPKVRQTSMEAFFSRVAYKGTAEWKEEIVCLDPSATEPLIAHYPYGGPVKIEPWQDPRGVFADWLITAENPWFTQNIVNRIWAWLFGRGIIHEADNIGVASKASNPELLKYLQKELVQSKYDLRHIYRLILNSQTYQQSSIPQSDHADAQNLFAYYPVRRLEAEVLIDALCKITGSTESYSSAAPEPFTFIPEENRTIELADGSTSSQFLEMFGRPSRDTGMLSERNNKSTDAQRLHMLNSTHVQGKIEKSWRLRGLMRAAKGKRPVMVDMLYVNILSRQPTKKEIEVALKYFGANKKNIRIAINDLTWALINSKEFLYRH